jgi:predicted PP-loop superfamily ATPase
MMAKFKDFGVGEATSTEPITFALHGETFECKPALQGRFLLNLVAQSGGEDAAASAAIVNQFFKEVLLDESFERFEALSSDPDRIVTVETLGEITGWLVGEYSERPTQLQESSSNGQ